MYLENLDANVVNHFETQDVRTSGLPVWEKPPLYIEGYYIFKKLTRMFWKQKQRMQKV